MRAPSYRRNAFDMKATAPIDMLRQCRAHFATEANVHRRSAGRSKTVMGRAAAITNAELNEKMISHIDATLRDWE